MALNATLPSPGPDLCIILYCKWLCLRTDDKIKNVRMAELCTLLSASSAFMMSLWFFHREVRRLISAIAFILVKIRNVSEVMSGS